MSTGKKIGSKLLGVIEPARAQRFLLWLANAEPINVGMLSRATDEGSEAEQLRQRFPEMASPLDCRPGLWPEALTWIQLHLQRAWNAGPDDRLRDWCLYEMRRYYRDAIAEASFQTAETKAPGIISTLPQIGTTRDYVDARLVDPPPITPFEATVFYFQKRIGDRAKHCGHVDCPAPYFIARKRWQKFCSEECAGPANRESKRKWWNENRGKEK